MSDLSLNSPSTSQQKFWDAAALALPLVGLAPLLVLQIMDVWSRSNTVLLPFCWLVLIAFAYYERKAMSQVRSRVLLGYIFLTAALAVGVASVIYFSPWLANLALAFVFIGWASVRFVNSSFTRILALSMLILVTLDFPLGYEELFNAKTNSSVVWLCSSVLDLFGIYHLYSLPYLALKDDYFEIAELLGNFFSIRTMVAIAIIVSLAWQRSFITTVLNIVCAVGWTVLGKIVFLYSAAAFSNGGINITESLLGTLILVVLFVFFLVLLLTTDGFWSALLGPIRAGEEGLYRSGSADFFNTIAVWPGKIEFQDRASRTAKPAKAPSTLVAQPMVAIAIGVLFALMVIPTGFVIAKNDLILNRANYLSISSDKIPNSKLLADDFLPKQRQRQFRILTSSGISGGSAKSLLWSYGGSGVDTLLSLRFPVRGWKPDLKSSFRDWKIVESKLMNDESKWPWLESDFEGQNGGSGLLLTAQLHTKGDPYIPTADEMANVNTDPSEKPLTQLFDPKLFEMMNPKQEVLQPQTFFVQMRFQSETIIRPNEKQQLVEKFKEARKIFADKLLGRASGPTP